MNAARCQSQRHGLAGPRRFIAVVGHEPELARPDGAVALLRGLGAEVRTLALWAEPELLFPDAGGPGCATARAIVVEVIDRVDWAPGLLKSLRTEPALQDVGAIVAVSVAQVACLDPASGFDDFVLVPYVPAELYARVRSVEWRRSDFATDERIKLGPILIDRPGRLVTVDGALVPLTAREFALLTYLCERRGRVVSRPEALARVWGEHYDGGPRTVDIHVRRLRQKLGDALPLETLRGAGYKIAPPDRPPGRRARPAARPGVVSAGRSNRPSPAARGNAGDPVAPATPAGCRSAVAARARQARR